MIKRLTLIAASLAAWPLLANAQGSARQDLKRTLLPAATLPTCPASQAVPPTPSDAQRMRARDAAARGQQAAILGDSAASLGLLRDAAAIDPSDSDLAYQLARVYESSGAADSAVKQYCRFLALAPNAREAQEARDRVVLLARPISDPAVDSVNAVFQRGLAAYDRGRMVEAETNFSRAITARPAWADAYFDRALTRLARDDRPAAASDFDSYLRAKPEATDRPVVVARIDRLRQPPLSAAQAFTLGVIIPGAGQFYTHRPAWGLVWLASAGGIVGYALVPHQKTVVVHETANDPFGNPYTYDVTTRGNEWPYLVPGIATAGTIAVLAAIEAALYAHRSNDLTPRVAFSVMPVRGTLTAMVTVR
jgi:tetratricopeptide (TPR) repeat protein